MKRFIFLLACICSFSTGAKSQAILDTLQLMQVTELPFQITYKSWDAHSYDVSELAKKIPIGHSYNDMNALLKDNSSGEEPEVFLKYRLPDQNGKYFFHAFARNKFTDSSTSDYLILMEKNGKISDYIQVGMHFAITGYITMDFNIDSAGTITTHQFNNNPNSTNEEEPVSFIGPGERTDRTYTIEKGKFVLKDTKQETVAIQRKDLIVPGKNGPTLLEVLQEKKLSHFPFYDGSEEREPTYSVEELAEKIPINNSYKDINATIKDTCFDNTEVSLDYRLPDQDDRYYFYVNASFTDGSVSDYLVLMDKDGIVSDYLWVGLLFPASPIITTRSCKIDASGDITVYQIKSYPNSKRIDPYDKNLRSFIGQRTDRTYQIQNGKFVCKRTKTYPSRVYQLSDLSYDKKIWESKEASDENEDFHL